MKIAEQDRVALNHLYAGQVEKMTGSKVASGAIPDAFSDHEEYLNILQEVLAEDLKDDPHANDYFKD